jgi:AhpC/TSA family
VHLWSVLQYVDLAHERDIAWAEQQIRAILAVNKNDQVRRLGAYKLAALLALKGEAWQAEAEKWIRECLRISQRMKAKGGKDVDATEGEAQLLLAKIQRFGLGKPAPDIAGHDLDSQAFKLSDYRGKVVLLDFWGFW